MSNRLWVRSKACKYERIRFKLGLLNAFYRSLGVDLHLPPNIDFDEGAGQEQNVPTKPEVFRHTSS